MPQTMHDPGTRQNVLFLGIFLLLLLQGCSTYVKYRYGIRQPETETPGSILGFLEKNGFPADHQYVFKDTNSFLRWMNGPDLKQHLLSHLIFNKQGQRLREDTAACQWAGGGVISNLHPDSSYLTMQDIALEQIAKDILPVGICRCIPVNDKQPDFTIVVTWGKFLGKYNYRLFDLEKDVLENHQANIRMIWLNIDIQKEWKFPPDRKLQMK